MNALTLYQPWASLVAMGAKTIETRSWRPPAAAIGERLAIHAAAGVSPWPWPEGITWRDVWPPGESAESMTRPAEQWMVANGREVKLQLPRGAVVASCVLADVVPIVADGDEIDWGKPCIGQDPDGSLDMWQENDCIRGFSAELPFGDFSPGRFAWLLEDVKPTTERCPACWGRGELFGDSAAIVGIPGGEIAYAPCSVCGGGYPDRPGAGACDPIPAVGHQRIWQWKPGLPSPEAES